MSIKSKMTVSYLSPQGTEHPMRSSKSITRTPSTHWSIDQQPLTSVQGSGISYSPRTRPMHRRTREPSTPPSRLPHGPPPHERTPNSTSGECSRPGYGCHQEPSCTKRPRPSYHLLSTTIASTTAIRATDTTSQHLLPHLHVPTSHFRSRPARHVSAFKSGFSTIA